MSGYAEALTVAIQAAREAGEMLRQEFHRPGGPKGSGSHAAIDEPAEQFIRKKLLATLPTWGYLGEEIGSVPCTDEHHIWLVDPNDGTSAYLKGWRGSAVSIGALRDGVPILGVVYAFGYPDDAGDLIAWAEGCPLTRNGQPLEVNLTRGSLKGEGNVPAIVFVSQDADNNPSANLACVQPGRFMHLASIAYRLARVAAGDGVAAVSLAGPGDWDYCAGHALLRAAAGILIDETGQEAKYDTNGRSSTHWCFGGSPAAVNELCMRDWKQVFKASKTAAAPYCLLRPVTGRAVADAGMLSRAQGCLLGQLAGDALGGLVEFRDPAGIKKEFPDGVRDLLDGGTWHNLAGQPTDDSEMALMLARALVHQGEYDRGKILDAYLHWWPMAWDRGSTLSQALAPACSAKTTAERLEIVNTHASQSSQSNGCLMRISPLGIFGATRPAEAAAWAREDSRLTHPHPVCQEACAAYVAAIATAIAHGGTPEACYQAALAEVGRQNSQPVVVHTLEKARTTYPADYCGQMGWVLIALQNAFYQLLHAPSLEEGVVDTVMHGGDTDTNGAIAGALLGAVYGRTNVPPRWLQALLSCRPIDGTPTRHPQPQEFWPVDALELAEALLFSGQ